MNVVKKKKKKEAKAAQQILAIKLAKVVQQRLNQAESRIYEAAVAIQSKVRQMQATLHATITSPKQQGSSQAMIPKTQAGKLSKKTSEQSEQGKSLQSKQHNSEGLLQSEQSTTEKEFVQRDGSSNSGKSLRSKQDKQAQQDDSEKYLRSKPSKQGDLLQTTEIRERQQNLVESAVTGLMTTCRRFPPSRGAQRKVWKGHQLRKV